MSNMVVNSTGLDKISNIYETPLKNTKDSNVGSSEGFNSIFDASLNMINETNAYQQEAKQLQLDFASGKTDDILEVTLAQQKAMSALSFTVQVTNKLVDAYKEIMQIQL